MRDPSAPGIWWLFFSPSGRIGRQLYALSFLFWVVVSAFVLSRIVIADSEGNETGAAMWFLALMAVALASALSLFFLSFKRLHDLGFPGPLAVVSFVPAVSIFFVIALMAWPGTQKANEYGAEPNRPNKA